MAVADFLYDIREVGGIYFVEVPPTGSGQRLRPIKMENGTYLGKAGTLADGWEPSVVYGGLAPFYLLVWSHKDGNYGLWYLDAGMTRIGGDDKAPPPGLDAVRQQRTVSLLMEIWDGLLCSPELVLSDRAVAFCRLPRSIKTAAINRFAAVFDLSFVDLEPMRSEDRSQWVFNGTRLVEVRSAFLLKILDEQAAPLERLVDGLDQAALTWCSPVDGRPLATDSIIAIDDFQTAYRLVDDLHGLVFYAVASGHDSVVLELLFPASRQIFSGAAGQRFRLDPPVAQFGQTLIQHLCENGELLRDFLSTPHRRLTCLIRGLHHGHLLLNDLSGLDELVHRAGANALPDVLIRESKDGSSDAEVFGRIEDLFPGFAGKVHRFGPDWATLIALAYKEGLSLVRATREYVPRRLAERVLEVNLNGPELESEHRTLEAIGKRGWPIILLDLRVENRTLVDLPGYCIHLIEFLLDETDGVAVVLSGHAGAYVGSLDGSARRLPVQVQKDIVLQMQRRFAGQNIELIDNVGRGMQHNIFWSQNSHFFVAPWGASMAIYRWITNKPGLVLSNQWNQDHGRGPNFDIYNSVRIMEAPGPMTFLAAEHIEDAPEVSSLSEAHWNVNPGAIVNFRINEPAMFSEVRRLLEKYSPSRIRTLGST